MLQQHIQTIGLIKLNKSYKYILPNAQVDLLFIIVYLFITVLKFNIHFFIVIILIIQLEKYFWLKNVDY